jgi:hypothetical protein
MFQHELDAQTGAPFCQRHLGAHRLGCDPRPDFSPEGKLHEFECLSARGEQQRTSRVIRFIGEIGLP